MIQSSSMAQPAVTFVTILTFGIIIAVKINTNPDLIAVIILVSFILAIIIVGFELRAIINKRVTSSEYNGLSERERDLELAKKVAELFDEDIPFDN